MTSSLQSLEQLLADPKTLVVVNHSGGKDSQAMYLKIRNIVPPNRLVVIHAHLPEVEWDGIEELITETINHEFHIVQAKKTFFQMVEHRKMFPSPANRQCTSDLKRNPISKRIIKICNEVGFNKVVNCMGLRAEESSKRAKKKVFRNVPSQSNSKRTWYEWLPIHELTTEEVFENIRIAGQKPHWAYAAGMKRLSCCFCIMSCQSDILTAKRLKPQLFEKYAEVERRLNFTMTMPVNGKKLFLDQY